MMEQLEKLIELQRIDNRIFGINKILSNVPDYILEIQNEYDTTNKKFSDLKLEIEKKSKELGEITAAFEKKKNLLDNSHKKLSTVKNTKEYEAVLKELDLLKKELYDLELKQLELNEELSNLEKEFKDVESKKLSLDEKYAELQKRRDVENEKITEELKELEKIREEVGSGIKKQLLSKYETIRKARNNLAIVRVEDEVCSGCYMKIPPQLYVEVKKNISIIQCPNCQRFLYYKEGE
ncbi:MAG: zinc ribbon domain-containing protein [Calditerrivibrio sp.]|uniref:zinc ribbon domain-containing protein n=1 Tax=Calditerrivibrio sp. TaxID=2792612 RepID=UPI003D10135A